MLVQLSPDFQNARHQLVKDVWCHLGKAQKATMGGKESKQFPISYDEASKRGESDHTHCWTKLFVEYIFFHTLTCPTFNNILAASISSFPCLSQNLNSTPGSNTLVCFINHESWFTHFSKRYKSEIAVTDLEKRRLQDAFRRSSAANNNISKQVLIQDNPRLQWNERWECYLCKIGSILQGFWTHFFFNFKLFSSY